MLKLKTDDVVYIQLFKPTFINKRSSRINSAIICKQQICIVGQGRGEEVATMYTILVHPCSLDGGAFYVYNYTAFYIIG